MNVKYIEVLREIDRCIRFESTGTPKFFACRLGMSERHMYNYLNVIRYLGGEVKYNRCRQSFQYTKESKLVIGVFSEN